MPGTTAADERRIEHPTTMEEWRQVGMKLKANGHPIGQSLGHSIGDPNGFCYSMLWGFGGQEIAEDGKTVAIDSKGTREALKFVKAFFKDACDEGGLAWDDGGNNRAYFAGESSVNTTSRRARARSGR